MEKRLNVVIRKENDVFVARCVENDVTSEGRSMEEALANLEEILTLLYGVEEFMGDAPRVLH